jgi:hypothetical protein
MADIADMSAAAMTAVICLPAGSAGMIIGGWSILSCELRWRCLRRYKYYQQPSLPIGVGPDDFPETLFHEWHAKARDGERGVSIVCAARFD